MIQQHTLSKVGTVTVTVGAGLGSLVRVDGDFTVVLVLSRCWGLLPDTCGDPVACGPGED